jgi:hypothetical protein
MLDRWRFECIQATMVVINVLLAVPDKNMNCSMFTLFCRPLLPKVVLCDDPPNTSPDEMYCL